MSSASGMQMDLSCSHPDIEFWQNEMVLTLKSNFGRDLQHSKQKSSNTDESHLISMTLSSSQKAKHFSPMVKLFVVEITTILSFLHSQNACLPIQSIIVDFKQKEVIFLHE